MISNFDEKINHTLRYCTTLYSIYIKELVKSLHICNLILHLFVEKSNIEICLPIFTLGECICIQIKPSSAKKNEQLFYLFSFLGDEIIQVYLFTVELLSNCQTNSSPRLRLEKN